MSLVIYNDKAFAVSGRVTQAYMKSESLTKPRIHQSKIKEIILVPQRCEL
jgi:HindVP restriction endonuclease